MAYQETTDERAVGWEDLYRRRQARPLEWIVEKGIFLVSLSAIVMVFLIFLFIVREALPIFLGQMDSSSAQRIVSVQDMRKMSPGGLQNYLDITPQQYEAMDDEAREALMETKIQSANDAGTNKDAEINATRWRYLIGPNQWNGYPKPAYIWQPVSQVPKYNIIPLLIGSLKATAVALLFSVPLALGAAIFVSQLCSPRKQEFLKPAIELLAGIPSVVLGFFALMVMSTALKRIFHFQSPLNVFVAGIALGLAIIPVVFSIAEDALTSVPRSYTHAALALGSSRWQAAWNIVLPAAIPGVFAAVVLGFGRAIGETMIVLMASGNASIVSWSLFDSARTMTAAIAAELSETPFGGHHYRILFMLGSLLFIVTFICNMAAELVITRLKRKLEGKR